MIDWKKTLEDFITYSFDKGFFNGNWLLKKQGEIVSRGSLGPAHPARGNPLREDMVFEMASVSKHFTATAVLILRDRGALSLDDPLEKYFPGAPYPGIVVKNLLNHTSGLPDYMEWLAEKGERENTIYPNAAMEDFLLHSGLPALFAPGEGWSYCNTAYALLALIIEKASGKSFADFMRDEIFAPCGMTSSCVYHRRLHGETIENYAYGMVLDGGVYKLPEDTAENRFVIPLDGIEGDGIVNTTLDDMLAWDCAQRSCTVLSAHSQAEMAAPTRLKNGDEYPYGYGWRVGTDADAGRILQHSGGWPGYNTYFARLLDEDSMLVCMLNQTGCDSLARKEVFEGMVEILCGREPALPAALAEQEDQTVGAAELARRCGSYEGGIEVYTDNDRLMMRWNEYGQKVESRLVPLQGGGFYLTERGCRLALDGRTIRGDLLGRKASFSKKE